VVAITKAIGVYGSNVALAAGALVLFLLCTWHGIGLRPDSIEYLGLAPEGFQQGPTYTGLISLLSAAGLSAIAAATALNFLLLLANLGLTALLLRGAEVPAALAALATALILLAPQFLYVHVTVLSEPLAIGLLLSVTCLLGVVLRGGSLKLAVAAGGLAGLCVLTRFALVPIVAAGSLALLLYHPAPFRTRLVSSFLYGGSASAIFALWFVSDQMAGGPGVGREAAFLGSPDTETWTAALDTLAAYLLPSIVPNLITYTLVAFTAAVLAALVVLACWPRKNPMGYPGLATARIASLFLATYVPFIVFALFVEANLTIHARYVLPVFLAAILLVFSSLFGTSGVIQFQPARPAVLLLLLLLAFSYLVRSVEMALSHAREGNFYASPEWRDSATLARARGLPDHIAIYSNGHDVIRLLAGREAARSPQMFERRTGQPDPGQSVEEEIARLQTEVANGTAVVVFFDAIDWRFYLVNETELVEKASLPLLFAEEDGRVYGLQEVLLHGQ
jgi:hypothetical protein